MGDRSVEILNSPSKAASPNITSDNLLITGPKPPQWLIIVS